MYLLLCLPKTKKGNHDVLEMVVHYTTLIISIHLAKLTAKTVAREFSDHCIIPYGIYNLFLTYKGQYITPKFFTETCRYMAVNNLTIVEYNLHAEDEKDPQKHGFQA